VKTTFVAYKKYLIPALLLGSLAGGIAISPVGSAIAQGGMSGARGWFHHMPSPEAMQRMHDGEIAGAVAALKMTDDQLKLWAPLEKLIRDQQADQMKQMQEHLATQQSGATPPAPLALPDRLDKMAERVAKHAEQMKALAATFKPFYATLSDAQKEVVGPLLGRLHGGPGGHGGGHGMGFGRGHHGHMDGQMGDGPAPDAKP
jgi:LTXXQ motif family protein